MDSCSHRLWAAGWALVISACSSGTQPMAAGGQTGSAGCTNPPDCVCDAVRSTTLLRGTIRRSDAATSADPARVAVEVTQVFSPDADIEVGAELEGSFQRGLPCGEGSLEALPTGTEVLVSFEQSMFVCDTYQACLMQCQEAEPGLPDGGTDCVTSCREQSADACQALRQASMPSGHMYLVVWQETLELTDEVMLAQQDAALLVDTEACRERFATTEEVECHGAF